MLKGANMKNKSAYKKLIWIAVVFILIAIIATFVISPEKSFREMPSYYSTNNIEFENMIVPHDQDCTINRIDSEVDDFGRILCISQVVNEDNEIEYYSYSIFLKSANPDIFLIQENAILLRNSEETQENISQFKAENNWNSGLETSNKIMIYDCAVIRAEECDGYMGQDICNELKDSQNGNIIATYALPSTSDKTQNCGFIFEKNNNFSFYNTIWHEDSETFDADITEIGNINQLNEFMPKILQKWQDYFPKDLNNKSLKDLFLTE